MTDEYTDIPALCRELTDEEWTFLSDLRYVVNAIPSFDIRPLIRAGLVVLSGDLWTITARGQACLDHARATWEGLDKPARRFTTWHGRLWNRDVFCSAQDAGLVAPKDTPIGLVCAFTPWGRAVARVGRMS